MKLIVGLGNPGTSYEMTRHNIGFLVLDELARRLHVSFRRSWRFPARIAKGQIGGEKVWLVKPQTFMNRSGRAVGPLLRKNRAEAADVLLVYDDIALESGQLRVRQKGSAGGHNGVQSVMDALGVGSFVRIRVGIGQKPAKLPLSDYVLGPFSEEEKKGLNETVEKAADAVEMACDSGVVKAMNAFN